MIRLEILADPVCPWCYIGKGNLERALEARADHQFAISWHPYMLVPDMAPEGMDNREFLQARFGDPDRVVKLHLPVVEAAEKAGLPLALDKITRMPSTLNAHRLIHWAGIEGRQTLVVSALFRAHWVEGRDIGDTTTLAEIAEAQGLDRPAVERLLLSDIDTAEIRQADNLARERGITGVPTFVIGGQYVVTGAQPKEFWLQVIDELSDQLATDETDAPESQA